MLKRSSPSLPCRWLSPERRSGRKKSRGKIQKVDTSDRSIVLEDGTQLWLAESVSADALKEGATVKASYEEKDGKKVVTEIQVSQYKRDVGIGHAGDRRARSSPGGRRLPSSAPARNRRIACGRDHERLARNGNLHDAIRRVASRDLRRPIALDHADQLPGLGSNTPAPLAP